MEKVSADSKTMLKGLLVDNVKEVEVTENGKKAKSIILVTVPFVCMKAMQRANKFVITQLEKKLKVHVTMTAKRNIQSKWIKTHKSQMRPRNRTLTAVHEAILDDLIQPSVILAKRIRVRLDGTKLHKINLDQNDKALLGDKLNAISVLYKQLCQKECVFDF